MGERLSFFFFSVLQNFFNIRSAWFGPGHRFNIVCSLTGAAIWQAKTNEYSRRFLRGRLFTRIYNNNNSPVRTLANLEFSQFFVVCWTTARQKICWNVHGTITEKWYSELVSKKEKKRKLAATALFWKLTHHPMVAIIVLNINKSRYASLAISHICSHCTGTVWWWNELKRNEMKWNNRVLVSC